MIIIDNYVNQLNERSVFEHSFDNLNETFNVMLNEGVGNVITNLKNLLKKFIDFLKRKIIELKNAISSKFSKSKVIKTNKKIISSLEVNLDANFSDMMTKIKNLYLQYSEELSNYNNRFLDSLAKSDKIDLDYINQELAFKNMGKLFDDMKLEKYINESIGYTGTSKDYKGDEIDKYYKFLDKLKKFYKDVSLEGVKIMENLTKQLSDMNNSLSKYEYKQNDQMIALAVKSYVAWINDYKRMVSNSQNKISQTTNHILTRLIDFNK